MSVSQAQSLFLSIVNTADEGLQQALDTALPQLLTMLADAPKEVTDRVAEALGHTLTRIKAVPDIKLNISALCELLEPRGPSVTQSPFLVNFTLMFLPYAVRTALPEARLQCRRLLIHLHERPSAQRGKLLHLFLQSLLHFQYQAGDEQNRKEFARFVTPQNNNLVLVFLQDVLLVRPSGAQGKPQVPPGLSLASHRTATNAYTLHKQPAELANTKMCILRFLVKSCLFTSEQLLSPMLIAKTDSHHDVVQLADTLSKALPVPDLEQKNLVQLLAVMYLGSKAAGQRLGSTEARSAAAPELKLVILQKLCNSRHVTNNGLGVKILFDALFVHHSFPRLQETGMQFMAWFISSSTSRSLAMLSPLLLKALMRVVDPAHGWRLDPNESAHSAQFRGRGYSCLGSLCLRRREVLCGEQEREKHCMALAELLFGRLESESRFTRPDVKSALVDMSVAFAHGAHQEGLGVFSDATHAILFPRLQRWVECDNTATQVCALQWLRRVYPYSHIPSRLCCLSVSGLADAQVRDIASLALRPQRTPQRTREASPSLPMLLGEAVRLVQQEHTPSALVCCHLVQWVMRVWEDQERGDEELFVWLQREHGSALESFVQLLHSTVDRFPFVAASHAVHEATLTAFLRLLRASNGRLSSQCLTRQGLQWLAGCVLKCTGTYTRCIASACAAHVLLHATSAHHEEVAWFVRRLCEAREEGDAALHGGVVGVAQACWALHHRWEEWPDTVRQPLQDGMSHVLSLVRSANAVKLRRESQHSRAIVLHTAVCQAVAIVCSRSVNTLTLGGTDSDACAAAAELCTSLHKLCADNVANEHRQLTRAAVQALGRVGEACGGREGMHDVVVQVRDALLGMARVREEEILFTVGEALSRVCSTAREHTQMVVELLLDKMSTGSAVVRSAASCWLLCLLRLGLPHDSHLASESTANALQRGLFGRLHDSRKFTVRCAAKALAVQYHQAPESLQVRLLANVSGMMVSVREKEDKEQREAIEAHLDSLHAAAMPTDAAPGAAPSPSQQQQPQQPPQQQPSQPPQQSLTSAVKDLYRAAQELHSASLFFDFLDLCIDPPLSWPLPDTPGEFSHELEHQERCSLDMGCLQHIKQRLCPDQSAVLCRLFTFQFHPNPRLRTTMRVVWKELVPDPAKAIDAHFAELMKQSLKATEHKSPSSREAALLALTDLLQGRSLSELTEWLVPLWRGALTALDDIRDSTRASAKSMARAVSNVSQRLCNPTLTPMPGSSHATQLILPMLLTTGVGHACKDSRGVALNALLEICKSCGTNLKPHLAEVTGTLMETLSTLEPAILNYLQVHANSGGYEEEASAGTTVEQLEQVRLSLARTGPLSSALSRCQELVDHDTLAPVMSRVMGLVRGGVGLPTLQAAANHLMWLMANPPFREHLSAHANRMVDTFLHGLDIRSPTLQKLYSEALGRACALADADKVEKVVTRLCTGYLDDSHGDERTRALHAACLKHITMLCAHMNQDTRRELATVAFVGMCDDQEQVKECFSHVWDELTASTSHGIVHFFNRIVDRIVTLLQAVTYSLRTTALAAATLLVRSTPSISQQHLPAFVASMKGGFLPALARLLQTRVAWKGKEGVLQCYAAVASCFKTHLNDAEKRSLLQDLLTEVTKLSQQQQPARADYVAMAVWCIGRVASVAELPQDVCNWLLGEVHRLVTPLATDDRQQVACAALDCLGLCFVQEDMREVQGQHVEWMATALCKAVPAGHWTVREAALKSIKLVCLNVCLQPEVCGGAVQQLVDAIMEHAVKDMARKSIRLVALDALLRLLLRPREALLTVLPSSTLHTTHQALQGMQHTEPKASCLRLVHRCIRACGEAEPQA